MVEDSLCRLDQAGKQSDIFRSFSLAWTILTFVLLLSGLIAWFYYRQHLIYIKKRGVIKPIMLCIVLTANTFTGPIDRSVPGRESVFHSCSVLNISYLVVVPFGIIAGLAQVILFRNRYTFYKSLGKYSLKSSQVSSRQSYFQGFDKTLRRKYLFANEAFVGISVVLLGAVAFSIIVGVVSTMCPEYGRSDTCQFATIADFAVVAVLFPPVIVGFVISGYIHQELKTFPDPFNLLGEIKTAFFYTILFSVPGLVLAAFNFGDPNGQEEVPFSYSVIIDAVLIFIFVYSVHWQVYIGMKFDEIQLLYRDITLAKVLEDKVGRDLFKTHLTNEFSLENLLFIETIEKLKRFTGDKVEKQAMNVYELFFTEDILNIQYVTKKEIKEHFEQGVITQDMYDKAYNEIYQLTSRDSFARFQLTPEFEVYVGLRGRETLAILE